MKQVDKIIVIASYDNGAGLTVWFDGVDDIESKTAAEISRKFLSLSWDDFLAYVTDFGRDLLIIENSCIEYIAVGT